MPEPMGFFTDTTVCIGCKACEVACKEWNQLPAANGGVGELSGDSYDNTRKLDAVLADVAHHQPAAVVGGLELLDEADVPPEGAVQLAAVVGAVAGEHAAPALRRRGVAPSH